MSEDTCKDDSPREKAAKNGAGPCTQSGRTFEQKVSRMGRREFTKTLSALGVSSATLGFTSRDVLAEQVSDLKKEVPYTAYLRVSSENPREKSEREAIIKTIPRDEWERRQAGLRARDKVGDIVDSKFAADNISLAFTGMDQSPVGFGVEIHVVTHIDKERIASSKIGREEIRKAVPQTVDVEVPSRAGTTGFSNVPTRVVSTSAKRLNCEDCQDFTEWDAVPGGTPIRNDTDNEIGSLTARFDHPDHGSGWVTAGHVVNADTGAKISQAGDEIGRSKEAYNDGYDVDYAFIGPSSDEQTSGLMANGSNNETTETVVGSVTTEELENNVDNTDYRLKTQGRTTCRTDGYITKTFSSPLTSSSAVGTSHDSDPGDSGGALFRVKSSSTSADEAYIAGNIIETYGPSDSDGCGQYSNTKSTTAQKVENNLGGHYF